MIGLTVPPCLFCPKQLLGTYISVQNYWYLYFEEDSSRVLSFDFGSSILACILRIIIFNGQHTYRQSISDLSFVTVLSSDVEELKNTALSFFRNHRFQAKIFTDKVLNSLTNSVNTYSSLTTSKVPVTLNNRSNLLFPHI